MRVHQENITADDADVLAGTPLATLEAGGQLDIMLVSSQPDTIYSVRGPDNEPIVQAAEVPNRTDTIRIGDDPTLSLLVRSGGHYTVDIDIVTAATVQVLIVYRKEGIDY